MNNYNLVIIENKQCIPFLNLTEQDFYDKLWEWTYEDNLWDYLEENHPTEEELNYVLPQFINDNIFHKYEDDYIDCFAFTNNDGYVTEYEIGDNLFNFIYNKIKEYHD